ncbi:Cytochrome P450, E-class, group I [Parasponia andersonii]|uniref:Cytochrome P450, E-class, group I n=1 Tax=Parasponia andersonii TaxID=3476 RepID=A0A2P5B3U2_PARAD|nr:Cytochrome P450, E-class, group I [Parasponia andersonii]
MAEMIKNPRVMKKAQDEVREVFTRKGSIDETGLSEMKYLRSVVKETMRLHPSLPFLLPRESRVKCEIKGYEIPAKTRIIVNAWAIGRDPRYWTEPESFIPERFLDSPIDFKGNNFEYIPFGAGRRICAGMSFALFNVELPLALLLYHFDWKLPSGMKHEDLDMTELSGASLRRKDYLNLIPIAYDLSSIGKSRSKASF